MQRSTEQHKQELYCFWWQTASSIVRLWKVIM